jgi:hypothetical protein
MYVPAPAPPGRSGDGDSKPPRAGKFIEICHVGADPTRPGAPPLVHAYELVVVERAVQRRVVFSSSRARCFATLAPRADAVTRHELGPPALRGALRAPSSAGTTVTPSW